MSGKYFKPTSDKPNLWTIMIYMAGDNDLDNFGISDLREIKRVGSSDHVQVIAELDRSGPEHLTKRYWLKDTAAGPALKHNILEQFEETDSGSPEQLSDSLVTRRGSIRRRHLLLNGNASTATYFAARPFPLFCSCEAPRRYSTR
jgi:hypothetical protein